MSYVLKVSKRGYDVKNVSDEKDPIKKTFGERKTAHILSALAIPYLNGARSQIKRYRQLFLACKDDPINGACFCLHEFSNLFEDINTVCNYLRKCGHDHKKHALWVDVRNHIRHDIRDEYDVENEIQKNRRSLNLKINNKFQTDIIFDYDEVKVGETVIKFIQINEYLDWSEKVITKILNNAKKSGYIN